MDSDRLAPLLADLADVSGYFHLYTDDAPPGPWRPLSALFGDGAAWAARVAVAAERIGTDEPRVAASILHLGVAARLWSPVVGAAAGHGVLLEWTADALEWKDALGGPLPLRLRTPVGRPLPDVVSAAVPLYEAVSALVEPLNDLVRGQVKLPRRLLWGNAASALGGAVRALARARPERADDALALGEALLDLGELRGTGDFEPGPAFRRTTCCLYYRVPHAGKCGDCVLLTPSRTRRARAGRVAKENP